MTDPKLPSELPTRTGWLCVLDGTGLNMLAIDNRPCQGSAKGNMLLDYQNPSELD
jgi:hypothetical protein